MYAKKIHQFVSSVKKDAHMLKLLTDAREVFEIGWNLWRPLSAGAGDLRDRSSRFEVVARIAHGVAREQL